ncbi:MAG: response regulator [Bacteroidota bacterium]|nr:response regulator [Bacteroidota bacterium]MDX5430508.1 response regulator [Bacteroidota bacterium]MDX5469264.1 response regulator [Bacteroidota bacterium]
MSTENINVLYVDDEQNNLLSFKAAFRREFNVHTAISGQEGLEIVKNEDIHIIITDQRMPGMTGVEFLQKVIPISPNPIRILLTGYSDINAVVDAINKGEVYRYMTKPWDNEFLKTTIRQAYEVFNLRRENERLIEELSRANEQLEFYLRQKLLS